MKKIILKSAFLSTALFFTACNSENKNDSEEIASSEQTAENSDEETSDAVADSTKTVLDIFSEFPATATTAKPGEYILIPSYKMLENYVKEENTSLIYYDAKMSKPGEKTSMVAFTFDGEKEVPNHLIVPIPAKQEVKKGDIILTWWQSGSGLQRAIVTDASDPTAPEVHYMDIAWDNPAQKDGKSIGQIKEKIKENTFVKITEEWQPGTTIAYQDGTTVKKAILIATSGDKVLTLGFAGSMKVLDKSASTALKINNTVKVGDKVQAPWANSFKSGVIKELKPEYGRAVVKFDHIDNEEEVIALCDITTGLVL